MLLRSMILDDMPDRDMENALEHAYQKAYNSGLRVVTIDDEHMWTMFAGTEDIPLREHATSGITDGEEYTIDHSTVESLLLGAFDKQERTDFSKLPVDTFKQFLEKADQAYYERDGGNGKRRSLHWELYSARDHERARPYVVAGVSFFSRLAKELVKLSRQPWISDKDRLVREYERLNYNVKQLMKNHAIQYFRDEIEFPPMVPPAELAGRLREWIPNAKADVKRGYGYLRQKQSWVTKKND